MIGHLVWDYLPLTQNWIRDEIRFQRVFPSLVLALGFRETEPPPDYQVHALSSLPAWRRLLERVARRLLIGYYPYFLQVARQRGVGVLHAHFGPLGLFSVPLARALGVPLITSFYGSDLSRREPGARPLHARYARLFAAGAAFLVEGPAAKAGLESIGCPADRIRIQRLGVDLDALPSVSRSPDKGGPIRVLMAATFTEKKGLPYGVEAFCQAADTNPRLSLTVVGDARPGYFDEKSIKSQLQNIVRDHHMERRARFLGYVPPEQLFQIGVEHHIFLHPSVTASTGDSEGGSPVVITQMAALELPIISTYHADIPQVVLDGGSGFLCQERSTEQLRAALLHLADDADLRQAMGRRGRQHVADQFCARRQGRELGEVYRAVTWGVCKGCGPHV